MTQTTAERLDTLIGENCVPMPNGWTQTSPDATQHVVETIAVEIEALTAERDEARADVNRLLHERDAAQMSAGQWQAEVERLRPLAAEYEKWRTMFPVNTPAEVAMKLIRDGK